MAIDRLFFVRFDSVAMCWCVSRWVCVLLDRDGVCLFNWRCYYVYVWCVSVLGYVLFNFTLPVLSDIFFRCIICSLRWNWRVTETQLRTTVIFSRDSFDTPESLIFFLKIFTVANELLKFRNVHILPLKLSCCRANCGVLLLKCVGRLCDINAKVVNRFNIFFFHWQFSIQMRAYDTVYRVPTEVTELSIKSRRHVVRIGYLV